MALADRLGGRNTERQPVVAQRLRAAVGELGEALDYDYVVVNADKTQAVAEVAAILDAESHRPARQADLSTQLQDLIRDLADLADTFERT
jgi:guanylate kinase